MDTTKQCNNVCSKCNKKNVQDAVFCQHCGTKLTTDKTQQDTQPINLSTMQIEASTLRLIPVGMAKKYLFIPLTYEGKKSITVAMSNPLNSFAIDDIRFMTGCGKVNVLQAPEADIISAISKHYGVKAEDSFQEKKDESSADNATDNNKAQEDIKPNYDGNHSAPTIEPSPSQVQLNKEVDDNSRLGIAVRAVMGVLLLLLGRTLPTHVIPKLLQWIMVGAFIVAFWKFYKKTDEISKPTLKVLLWGQSLLVIILLPIWIYMPSKSSKDDNSSGSRVVSESSSDSRSTNRQPTQKSIFIAKNFEYDTRRVSGDCKSLCQQYPTDINEYLNNNWKVISSTSSERIEESWCKCMGTEYIIQR